MIQDAARGRLLTRALSNGIYFHPSKCEILDKFTSCPIVACPMVHESWRLMTPEEPSRAWFISALGIAAQGVNVEVGHATGRLLGFLGGGDPPGLPVEGPDVYARMAAYVGCLGISREGPCRGP